MASADVGDTLHASTSGFMMSSPKLATFADDSNVCGSSSSSSASDDDTTATSRLLTSGSVGAVLRQNVAISTGKRNGSLHMVADKLKDRLSRQLEESKATDLDSKTDVDADGHVTGTESNTSSQEIHRSVAMATSRSQYHSIQQLCKPARHSDVMSNSSGDIVGDDDDVMSSSTSPGTLHNNNNDHNTFKIDNDITDDVGADSSPSSAHVAANVDDVSRHVTWSNSCGAWSVANNLHPIKESQLLKTSGESSITDDVTRSESASTVGPEVAAGVRRQRRKQYVPLQHQLDARQPSSRKRSYIGAADGEEQEEDDEEEEWRMGEAWIGESGWDEQNDMEADSEKLRQGLQLVARQWLPSALKRDGTAIKLEADDVDVALWQGLQRVQQRLAEMQLKYLRYLDDSVDNDDVIVDVSGDNDETEDDATKRDNEEATTGVFASDINRNEVPHSSEMRSDQPPSGSSNNVDALARRLKAEISDSVGSLVDDIVRSFVERHFGSHRRQLQTQQRGLQDRPSRSRSSNKEDELPFDETWQPRRSSEINVDVDDNNVKTTSDYTASGGCPAMSASGIQFPAPVLPSPSVPLDCESFRRAAARIVADQYALRSAAAVAAYLDSTVFQHSKTAFDMPPHHSSSTVPVGLALPLPTASSTPNSSRLFNPAAYFPGSAAALINHFQSQQQEPGSPFLKEPEQTEALPLIVGAPKKKRTKVTDTRLSPRAARALLQESLQQLHQQQQQQQSAFSHSVSPCEDVHSPGSLASFYQPMQHHHRHRHHHQRHQLAEQQQQQQQQHSPIHRPHHMASSPRHLHDAFPSNLFPAAAGSQIIRPQAFPPAAPPPTSLFQNDPCSPGHLSMHNVTAASLAHHHWRAMYAAAAAAAPPRANSGGIRGHPVQLTSLPVSGSSFERRSSPTESHHQPEAVSEMNQLRQSMSRGSLMKTADCRGGSVFDQFASDASNYDAMAITSTLTPMHLRKAKLMFFYVRYPSSTILKDYFPDVRFNKNNTAQLVKWFSNFREFFYIQMEKYARQALSEGVNNVSELIVTTDSELYRVLVLHYNRNNQIDVPEGFRFVVQAALREFYLSIVAEKDQEQSWKKAIYKVIARLDEVVPEYFKFPNWLEQLSDC